MSTIGNKPVGPPPLSPQSASPPGEQEKTSSVRIIAKGRADPPVLASKLLAATVAAQSLPRAGKGSDSVMPSGQELSTARALLKEHKNLMRPT